MLEAEDIPRGRIRGREDKILASRPACPRGLNIIGCITELVQ